MPEPNYNSYVVKALCVTVLTSQGRLGSQSLYIGFFPAALINIMCDADISAEAVATFLIENHIEQGNGGSVRIGRLHLSRCHLSYHSGAHQPSFWLSSFGATTVTI